MRRSSRSGLFLLELIIAITFFAVSGAVCVKIFAGAHIISQQSHNLNMAINYAQSAAECYKYANGDIAVLADIMPDARLVGQSAERSFDKHWNYSPAESQRFKVLVTSSQSDGFNTGNISVIDQASHETIYSLEVKVYLP